MSELNRWRERPSSDIMVYLMHCLDELSPLQLRRTSLDFLW